MIEQIRNGWDEFWFQPSSSVVISRLRLGVGILVSVWFATFLPTASVWFGEDGLLNLAHSSRLIGFAEVSATLNWSPLWLTDALLVYQAWIGSGIVLAILVALGIGGRIAVVALTISCIAWSHRIFWLTGPTEPAMMAMLVYLIVEPGIRVGNQRVQSGGSFTLAQRLFQVHVWILLAAGALSSLASLSWWRGEGAWWLASTGRSTLMSLALFEGRPWLVNLVSHGILIAYALTLWFLVNRSLRQCGLLVGWFLCVLLATVSDQVLYATLLAIGICAFAENKQAD